MGFCKVQKMRVSQFLYSYAYAECFMYMNNYQVYVCELWLNTRFSFRFPGISEVQVSFFETYIFLINLGVGY